MMAPVHRIHYRFGIVLCLIIVTIFFVMAAPQGDGARFVSVTLQAAVLIAAVIASKLPTWVIRLTVAAAVVGIAGSAAALFGTGEFGNAAAGIVALLYVLLTPPAIVVGVLKQFREEGNVTIHSMFGVLCLYLLVGLIFAVTFGVVQDVSSTDFFTVEHAGRDDFLYFSFATLTTVGYGDLVAATNLGRSLAIAEALLGQIYLVTVVALIVTRLRPAARRACNGLRLAAHPRIRPARAGTRTDGRAAVSAAARAGTGGSGPSRGSRGAAARSSGASRASAG
jgi:Ion channel